MSDILTYHSADDLQTLSLPELAELWELVPTDRQRRYKAVYDREVKQAGAVGSDALEKHVTEELLNRYITTALVPIGARWARTPTRIQEAVKNEADLIAPEAVAAQNRPRKPSMGIVAMAGVAFVVMVFFILPRLGGQGKDSGIATMTVTVTQTATPGKSPTPTPIALEQQDSVIRGGDGNSAVSFPVNLRVTLPDTQQPRIFIVQRRVIQTSEWNFDTDPDTATYIAALTVRPVIGIPYSSDNDVLFRSMSEGTTFTLQMNTGTALRFTFENRLEVSRSDTGIFRQVGPGLVLVQIGEHDTEGDPTATRVVITADYAPDQELARDGALTAMLPTLMSTQTSMPSSTLPPFSQLEVQVILVETQQNHIMAEVRIYNGQSQPVRIEPDTIWLALGYTPEPDGPHIPTQSLTPFDLQPGQAADLTLRWVWAGEPYARMSVGPYQFAIRAAQ